MQKMCCYVLLYDPQAQVCCNALHGIVFAIICTNKDFVCMQQYVWT